MAFDRPHAVKDLVQPWDFEQEAIGQAARQALGVAPQKRIQRKGVDAHQRVVAHQQHPALGNPLGMAQLGPQVAQGPGEHLGTAVQVVRGQRLRGARWEVWRLLRGVGHGFYDTQDSPVVQGAAGTGGGVGSLAGRSPEKGGVVTMPRTPFSCNCVSPKALRRHLTS